VLVGHEMTSLAHQVLWYGPDEVLVAESPLLTDYCNQAFVKALATAVQQLLPEVLLIGSTALGTDLAPRLAARLRTGLSAHCIDLDLTTEGHLLSIVPGWGGNILAQVICPRTRPQMATVMPGVFSLPEAGPEKGTVTVIAPEVGPEDVTYRIVETKREEAPKSGLETAEVVVAGGWGVGNKANWRLIEELATALNGAVGATRPPVDEGWAEERQMIGQSGRTVRPRLYIGVGISGHMHHLVGLKNVELMVGVNSDPNAPFFNNCHLGLVGDFKEIIPALIEAVKGYSDPPCR
jgi:electron transfer flavoprotein alpha subunit